MVTIEIISDANKFYSIRNEWNAVLDASGLCNPYLTHEFLVSWLKAYGKGKQLSIVVFKDDDSIIGFVPLVFERIKLSGLPVKALRFFADHWGSMDLILTGKREECIDTFIRWFLSAKKGNVLVLSRIPQESQHVQLFHQKLQTQKVNYEMKSIENAVIKIEGTWEEYLASRSKKFRYQMRDKYRKLEQLGQVYFERITNFSDSEKVIAILSGIGSKSWKGKQAVGIAPTQEGKVFYSNLLQAWGMNGNLDLSLLKLNDKPIAYAMRLCQNNRLYALETAFLPEYADYSPGVLVQGKLLEQLFNERKIEYYQLGQMHEHKSHWSDIHNHGLNLFIYNGTVFSRLLHSIRSLTQKNSCCQIPKYRKSLDEINVLMIGRGGEPLLQETNQFNQFVQYRHIKYAEHIKSLHVVIKTTDGNKWKPQQLSDKLFAYPTLSRNTYVGLLDLYRIGSRIIKDKDIDLIVTSEPFGTGIVGYFLKKRFKKPLCMQLFGDYAFNKMWQEGRPKRIIGSMVARFLLKRADSIRVMSQELKQKIVEHLGVRPEKIFTYTVIVDTKRFLHCQDSGTRQRLLHNTFKHIVLSVGRLTHQKDISTMLRAAALVIKRFPQSLFLIIGDGEEKQALAALAKQLSIHQNVLFLGHVAYGEMPDYFHACDIFVLSSAYEDMARVLLEASLSGKAIVTTKTTGTADIIIDGETGFVVAVKDYEALAQRIMELLENETMRVSFGNSAQQRIRVLFDEEKVIHGVTAMWHSTYLNN